MKWDRFLANKMNSHLKELMNVMMSLIFNFHLISTIQKNMLPYRKILICLFQVHKHFKKFLNFFNQIKTSLQMKKNITCKEHHLEHQASFCILWIALDPVESRGWCWGLRQVVPSRLSIRHRRSLQTPLERRCRPWFIFEEK